MQPPPLTLQPCSAQSTLTNKSRLKLLHRREEHLQDLFSTSRSSILVLAKDDGRYTQFLEGVVVQGFLQLMESNVTLLSRKKDAVIVKQAADAASKSYKEISGREVKIEIENTLSDEWYVIIPYGLKRSAESFLVLSAGGVKLISGSRRITIDNTLDERLRLLEDRVRLLCFLDIFGFLTSCLISRCCPRLERNFLVPTRIGSFIHEHSDLGLLPLVPYAARHVSVIPIILFAATLGPHVSISIPYVRDRLVVGVVEISNIVNFSLCLCISHPQQTVRSTAVSSTRQTLTCLSCTSDHASVISMQRVNMILAKGRYRNNIASM